VPDLPVNPDQRPPYRRRELLRIGNDAAWWTYESENPAGYVDAAGVQYDETTYTIRAQGGGRLTLLATEVEGFVLGQALGREGGLQLIAYRRGLLPEDPA
jgi:hypothetical protein